MMIATWRNHSRTGLVLAIVLHAFPLYFLSLGRSSTNNAIDVRYSRLVFVVTPPPLAALPTSPMPRTAAVEKRHGKTMGREAPVPIDPPSSVAETPMAVAQQDPFNEPGRMNIDSLIKQAGKADRETRSASDLGAYGPASDSMEAVMTRAFTAAKLAVPLKWYEAARIELFSAPNDPRRIYQVKTAFGTYCLYYPDTMKDQGGSAQGGQPRMSSCPSQFGKGVR